MPWTKLFGGPPWLDWSDDGKRVQLRSEDGIETEAVVFIEDYGVDGDGEEFPIWVVRLPDGSEKSLYDYEEWKFPEA